MAPSPENTLVRPQGGWTAALPTARIGRQPAVEASIQKRRKEMRPPPPPRTSRVEGGRGRGKRRSRHLLQEPASAGLLSVTVLLLTI